MRSISGNPSDRRPAVSGRTADADVAPSNVAGGTRPTAPAQDRAPIRVGKAAAKGNPLGWGDNFERSVMEFFPAGMENYVVPTATEMAAFKVLVAQTRKALQTRDDSLLQQAKTKAADIGYDLTPMAEANGRFLQLCERGEPTRGWGTVVFNKDQGSNLIVEIPHPGFDLGTPELGWRAFNTLDADVLILAGAHRKNRSEVSVDVPKEFEEKKYSISDPTHAFDTIFQAAHQAVTGPTSVVLQLHGFNAVPHHEKIPDFPVDQQFVITDGADDFYDPPRLVATQNALERAGYKSHICTFENEAMSELGGLPNVQRREMKERGLVGWGRQAEFIHIEMDRTLRRMDVREEHFTRFLNALKPVLARSAIMARVAAPMIGGALGPALSNLQLERWRGTSLQLPHASAPEPSPASNESGVGARVGKAPDAEGQRKPSRWRSLLFGDRGSGVGGQGRARSGNG